MGPNTDRQGKNYCRGGDCITGSEVFQRNGWRMPSGYQSPRVRASRRIPLAPSSTMVCSKTAEMPSETGTVYSLRGWARATTTIFLIPTP